MEGRNHDTTIDAFAVARAGASLSGELSLSELGRFCQGLPARAEQASNRVQWQVQGEYNAAGQAFLSVQAQAVAVLECQRCMSLFEQPLRVSNRLELVRNDKALEGDDAPDAVERIVGSERFDLLALIEDELILVLPYVPRHDVCPPKEGQPRQVQAEPVEEAKRPSPFAVLGKLKKPDAP